MASIFDSLKGLITPELITSAASSLGEEPANVTKAVTSAVPSLLGSILAKGNDSGLESILKKAGSAGDTLSNVAGIFSGKSDEATSSIGSGLLDSILGSKLSGLTSLISSVSGISGGSSGKLLSMLSPVIGGFLGNKMKTDGLNLSSLLGVLNSEKGSFMNAIPSGLSGVLGLSSLSSLGDSLSSGVKSATKEVSDVANKTKGGIAGLLKWLIPAAIILFGLFYAFRSCNVDDAKKDINSAATTAVDGTKAAATTAATAVADGIRSITNFSLPNGIKLEAYDGGIESQVLNFLESDAYKNATPEALKEKWFNFDNINFEFGSSTKLTADSYKQVDNMVAILQYYKDSKIKIGAYTDKKGDVNVNKNISQERANTIKHLLISKGVEAQIVGAEGYGSEFAKISADASDDERAVDRKIAIRFEK